MAIAILKELLKLLGDIGNHIVFLSQKVYEKGELSCQELP